MCVTEAIELQVTAPHLRLAFEVTSKQEMRVHVRRHKQLEALGPGSKKHLLRSPCHVIACGDGAVYKCVTTASTPTTPLLTRLREPPSSPPTLYVATATDVTGASEVAGNSRVALLTNCGTNFQDQFFPT
ncbi:hypothetical protein TSMEX_009278 [Taenia solium]|eukprot:TsM_000487100 transcript=TsM_000487100 gene=TsM_000487100